MANSLANTVERAVAHKGECRPLSRKYKELHHPRAPCEPLYNPIANESSYAITPPPIV